MLRNETYVDLKGREFLLGNLSVEERQLVAKLQERASSCPDWNEFDGFWVRTVTAFYDARKMSRKE